MANTYEELYCWQQGRELVNLVYSLTKKPTFRDFSLRDQIQRAVVSIISNIAEGFERGSKEEFLYFLYIAKGSCGEVRCQLYIALDQGYISKEEFNSTFEKSKQVSGLLHKFIYSFKSDGLPGLRYKKTPEQVRKLLGY